MVPTHPLSLSYLTHFLSLLPLVENSLGENLTHPKLWAQ